MSATSRKYPMPARPTAVLPSMVATLYAVTRELTYISCPLMLSKRLRWTSPPLGRLSMVIAELVLVLALCFYKLNPRDQWQWEDIGYRTGFITAAQLPLVVLLSSKRNIIGWLTGTSYERLSWLHRWVSRILFLSVTIHMGFWFINWARYDYIKVKLTTDPITQRGFAAWCILLWIVLSSLLPARRWNYEFFVVQHIMIAVGFFAAVYLHLPGEVKAWIWLPIGLLIFDRVVRAFATLFINVSIFNRKIRDSGSVITTATFEPLSGSTTRITIKNPPIGWRPGQHVFLTCHALAPLQAHPFTIASMPEDGKMEFLAVSKSGGTKRFLRHAEKSLSLPASSSDLRQRHTRNVILEGPYGRIRPLRQFDSVFLIAGSSGATFTVPLMREIVSCLSKEYAHKGVDVWNYPAFAFRGAATRSIRFIWVIKARAQYDWFRSQLANVADDVRRLKAEGSSIDVEMSIYVTCDEVLGVESPQKGQQKPFEPSYGKAEELTAVQSPNEDAEKSGNEIVSIQSIFSRSQSQADASVGCGSDGTCCCRETIEDEGVASGSEHQCLCNGVVDKTEAVKVTSSISKYPAVSTNASSRISLTKHETSPPSYSEIAMLTGRPQPRNLIRKTVEQALGESAVVVCGPQGLVDEVRQSVAALSDERAVHKGTGAQGIYLHAESFEY